MIRLANVEVKNQKKWILTVGISTEKTFLSEQEEFNITKNTFGQN